MKLKQRVLEKDGCPIHYWVTANHRGPWLIFMHGAGTDHRMFAEQLHVIDETYGLLLWDARGHGLSRPIGTDFTIKLLIDDMLAIMTKEGIEKATFIGQSMGGNAAQELVFHHPDKVESLVLIDCTCNTQKMTFIEKGLITLTPLLLSLYPWKMLVNQSARASSIKPDVQAYLRECFHTIGRKDFLKIFQGMQDCLHEEETYYIQKRFLLVCGVNDQTGNIKKTAPRWAKREPNGEFYWIDNASHCAHQDNPEAFNKVFLSFLDNVYSSHSDNG